LKALATKNIDLWDLSTGFSCVVLEPTPLAASLAHRSMFLVAKAFNELHTEFDTKFKAMWA
jgi:hypothetical protein